MLITTIADAVFAPSAQILSALAQTQSSPAPSGGRWIAVVITLLVVACVVLASLKSSKRTHQD